MYVHIYMVDVVDFVANILQSIYIHTQCMMDLKWPSWYGMAYNNTCVYGLSVKQYKTSYRSFLVNN